MNVLEFKFKLSNLCLYENIRWHKLYNFDEAVFVSSIISYFGCKKHCTFEADTINANHISCLFYIKLHNFYNIIVQSNLVLKSRLYLPFFFLTYGLFMCCIGLKHQFNIFLCLCTQINMHTYLRKEVVMLPTDLDRA